MILIPYEYYSIRSIDRPIRPIKQKAVNPIDIVTVTTYTVDTKQTDSTPLITASGFKLDSLNPKRHKIIAISRDLKQKYKFGQKVKVKGAGRLDGIYVVRDLMHHRWRSKIDILINPDDKHTKIRNVKLFKI